MWIKTKDVKGNGDNREKRRQAKKRKKETGKNKNHFDVVTGTTAKRQKKNVKTKKKLREKKRIRKNASVGVSSSR